MSTGRVLKKINPTIGNCGKAIKFLSCINFNSEKEYYRLRFSPPITPEDLENLVRLPYETSIIKLDNEFLLYTGSESSGPSENDADFGQYFSKETRIANLNFHTHTKRRNLLFPSIKDYALFYKIGNLDEEFLVSGYGIIRYVKPPFNTIDDFRKEADNYLDNLPRIKKILPKWIIEWFGDKLYSASDKPIPTVSINKIRQIIAKKYHLFPDKAEWKESTKLEKILQHINK